MRNLIHSLNEALSMPFSVIGGHPDKPLETEQGAGGWEPAEDEETDEDPVDEAVSASMISRMTDAMLAAPQLAKFITKATKGGQVSESDLVRALTAHIRGVLPLAMADAGANIQSSLAGRARRQAKAVGSGKSAMEAEEMENAEVAENDLSTEIDKEIGR